MEQNDRMKEARRGLNARLLLLAAGIMLVVNSVSSSARTGLSWLSLADLVIETQTHPAQKAEGGILEEAGEDDADHAEAVMEGGADHAEAVMEGDAEFDINLFIEAMDESNLTVLDLRLFGIFYLISAVVEILAGMTCAFFSNRVDKSKITFTAAAILSAWELIFLAFLLLRGGLMLSVLFNSILLPLVLLWAAWQMRKMAKADPQRVFAVNPGSKPVRKENPPAPRKSIRERASWEAQETDSAFSSSAAEDTKPSSEDMGGTD
ncbi:MAG: hypothetical protein IKE58_03140 [Blautia sp.]|nr:hypothetical protein [Blautia sp.]